MTIKVVLTKTVPTYVLEGEVDKEQCLNVLRGLRSLHKFPHALHYVHIEENVEWHLGLSEIREVSHFVKHQTELYESFEAIAFVQHDLSYGIMRMFISLFNILGAKPDLRLYRNFDQTLQQLEESVAKVSDLNRHENAKVEEKVS